MFRSPLFWLGLLLRCCFLPVFVSHYATELFLPFLDQAVLHPLQNPWSNFDPHFFPYGSILYLLLFIPKFIGYLLFGQSALGVTPLSIALLKLPLLGCELLLLFVLHKFCAERSKQILIYFWLNPILFYITYMHGQLDVAAMAFCVTSLYWLIQGRIRLSALTLAFAVLCKSHILLIIPFLLAYLWNREFARSAFLKITTWCTVFGIVTALGFLPLILAGRLGYVTAFSPEALRIFSAQFSFGTNHTVYLGIALLLFVLGRLCISTKISDRGLLFGCGALFGVLMLITDTMPGWYYWPMPFVVLFFSYYANAPRLLFASCCVLYLTYFSFFELQTAPGILNGNIFTVLQTCFAGLFVAMWKTALKDEVPLQGRMRPLLIGIAGDSGAGKNYLSLAVSDIFTSKRTTVVEGDDYHKWERGNAKWGDYTHLHPKANSLDKLEMHTKDLLAGRFVFHPHYDHQTGKFTSARFVRSNKAIIIQGLHTLYLRGMRDDLDLRIFVSPHESVRTAWKIKRDVKERGHPLEKVLQSMAKRADDSLNHIQPQRHLADWIIEVMPKENLSTEDIVAGKPLEIYVNHLLWNDAPIAELYTLMLEQNVGQPSLDIVENDINRIVFRVEGEPPSSSQIQHLAKKLYPRLRHITRGWQEPKWHGGFEGINQLIALALLSKRV